MGMGTEIVRTAILPDDCPLTFGNSTIDRLGCLDSDGDGYSDLNDDFPLMKHGTLTVTGMAMMMLKMIVHLSQEPPQMEPLVALMPTKILGLTIVTHSLWTIVSGMIPILTDTEIIPKETILTLSYNLWK